MKLKKCFLIWRILTMMVFTVLLSLYGCGGSSSVNRSLDAAESLMESRPDSALEILDSIMISDLDGKGQKARYALLKSMALDKNYVDTTTFDVLQPAIDYYIKNGTPDEKLRTYYYQGRIYQNRNERDSALHSFMRGLDVAEDCNDSLTIARTLVAQGIIYQSFYDYDGYTSNYLRAADIFRHKYRKEYEFDCLLNALNGMNILGNMEQADSIIKLLDKFTSLNDAQRQRLHSHIMTYTFLFGSKQNLKELIESDSLILDVNGILSLANAYSRLGDNGKALRQLDYLDEVRAGYDTLKYLSIKYQVLENLKKHEDALGVYKDFVDRLETINSAKFEQKSRSMEEKHLIELQAERDAERHRKVMLGYIGGLAFLAMGSVILFLLMRRNRIKKDLALQQVRAAEAENGKLKAENELALEQARVAEIENENLKTEKEKLTLANRNLQLERDNKALEAENLAHRVSELEMESADLKEVLESQKEMPEEVRKAIQTRKEMLNSYLASQISDHKEF